MPTFEVFIAEARRLFAFLISDFPFRETNEIKKYSNPFSTRFVSSTTIVVVEGIGHGSTANVGLGDLANQRTEFDDLVPLWTFATMSGEYTQMVTGDQLEDLVVQSRILRACAGDMLRGDLSRLPAAQKLLRERIELLRVDETKRDYEQRLRQATDRAAEAFCDREYEIVIAELAAFEAALSPAQSMKLALSRRTINDRGR